MPVGAELGQFSMCGEKQIPISFWRDFATGLSWWIISATGLLRTLMKQNALAKQNILTDHAHERGDPLN